MSLHFPRCDKRTMYILSAITVAGIVSGIYADVSGVFEGHVPDNELRGEILIPRDIIWTNDMTGAFPIYVIQDLNGESPKYLCSHDMTVKLKPGNYSLFCVIEDDSDAIPITRSGTFEIKVREFDLGCANTIIDVIDIDALVSPLPDFTGMNHDEFMNKVDKYVEKADNLTSIGDHWKSLQYNKLVHTYMIQLHSNNLISLANNLREIDPTKSPLFDNLGCSDDLLQSIIKNERLHSDLVFLAMAENSFQRGDYGHAIFLSKPLALDESQNTKLRQNAFNLIGNAYLKLNHLEDAKTAYEKTLLLDSSNVYAIYGLGNIEFRNSNFSLAIELYNKALNIQESNIDILLAKAVALERNNSPKNDVLEILTHIEKINKNYYVEILSEYPKLEMLAEKNNNSPQN